MTTTQLYMCPPFEEFAVALKKLNPAAEIRTEKSKYDQKIYSSVPANGLNLPEGFYCNGKGDVTNKYNTYSGGYMASRVCRLNGNSYN